MGLVGYNKRFLNLTIGLMEVHTTPGFYAIQACLNKFLNVQGLPDKIVGLGNEYCKIPLITIGDSAFPRF